MDLKMKPAIPEPISSVSEFLILPDGRILAQNITPMMAKLLSELNPEDKLMRQRARVGNRRNAGHKICKQS
jgi:hypothetical protein